MEIIVFSFGDARNPQTWSNVPHFAVKAMEDLGHTVHCVDIGPHSNAVKKLHSFVNKAFRFLLGRDTLFLAELWPVWKRHHQKAVQKAVAQHPCADLLLFFSYDLSGKGITNIPSVLFCDFTIDYAIQMLHHRQPKWYEKPLIKAQDEIMRNADLVVSLFPKAAEHYQQRYQTDNIYKISGHILNCDEPVGDIEALAQQKFCANEILFIGRKAYRQGALCLIDAVERYNTAHPDSPLHLNIIGMTDDLLGIQSNETVTCHGILNKADSVQRQTYYDLIRRAKCIANTTKNWGGISSITEAMLFGTPVITSKYDEFSEIFGESLSFGSYCVSENVDKLAQALADLLAKDKDAYAQLARNAHNSVKDFTWQNCIAGILDCSILYRCDDAHNAK